MMRYCDNNLHALDHAISIFRDFVDDSKGDAEFGGEERETHEAEVATLHGLEDVRASILASMSGPEAEVIVSRAEFRADPDLYVQMSDSSIIKVVDEFGTVRMVLSFPRVV